MGLGFRVKGFGINPNRACVRANNCAAQAGGASRGREGLGFRVKRLGVRVKGFGITPNRALIALVLAVEPAIGLRLALRLAQLPRRVRRLSWRVQGVWAGLGARGDTPSFHRAASPRAPSRSELTLG